MEIIDLSWLQIGIGFIILALPAYILWKYRTGLNKKLLTASIRMVLQLLFVGYYLEYLFAYDNPWINAAWIFIMVVVADFATVDRSNLRQKASVLLPIFGATFLGIIVIDLYFLEVVIQLPKLLAAQYTIPITGMVFMPGDRVPVANAEGFTMPHPIIPTLDCGKLEDDGAVTHRGDDRGLKNRTGVVGIRSG